MPLLASLALSWWISILSIPGVPSPASVRAAAARDAIPRLVWRTSTQ